MSAPNLSRRIASSIVEGLKARGRILVVKGETAALVREVDEALGGEIDRLAPSLGGPGEAPEARAGLERLIDRVVDALLRSEHLEDLFAERALVRREAETAARAAVRETRAVEEETSVRVSLDVLGYVAVTASKRARPEALREALERAGHLAGARLGGYDEAAREATFLPEDPADPDLRLTLEEAVADELTELVESGEIELPTIERAVALAHEVSLDLRAGLKRRIDHAATRTLRRAGCAATWEFSDGRTLRVTFTPLSEHDAREVDTYLAEFAREVNATLGEVPAPAPVVPAREAIAPPPPSPPPPAAAKKAPEPLAEPVPEQAPPAAATAAADGSTGVNGSLAHEDDDGEEAAEEEGTSNPARERPAKRASRTSTRPPASPRAVAKRTAAKRATSKRAAAPEEPARKKTAAKKRALPSASKTRGTPSKKR